jgi:hypothetical protein
MKSLCHLHIDTHPGDSLSLQRIPHDGTAPVPLCDFCGVLPARFRVGPGPSLPKEAKKDGAN